MAQQQAGAARLRRPLSLGVRRTDMNERFRNLVAGLETKWQALAAMTPIIAGDVPNDTPVGGVYLFSERTTHLYAGRTKRRIAIRIRNHFSTAPDCPFAWLLARETTGSKATYKSVGGRKALLADIAFKTEYDRAKLWQRSWGGRCLSLADYVAMPGPPDEATAAGGW